MTPISLRTGFATNSSSSHSIIYCVDPDKFPDNKAVTDDFGWNWFVQKTKEDKLAYFYQAFVGTMTDEQMASEWDVSVEDIKRVKDDDGYIDHQSAGFVPRSIVKGIIHSEEYAILGGNDNDDPPHWTSVYEEVAVDTMGMVTDAYTRFAESGEDRYVGSYGSTYYAVEEQAITTFNVRTGEKVRYNPKDDGKEVYLSFPELVDIKITDYCPYGCSYCYQDSTLDGLHASTETLFAMIDHLKKQGVFELAIGGGEPTLHPDFFAIIERCVDKVDDGISIKPNFTTRNLAVFRGEQEQVAYLLDTVGGFAYSVDNPSDVAKFKSLMDYWLKSLTDHLKRCILDQRYILDHYNTVHSNRKIIQELLGKVSFQVVLGSMSRDEYTTLVASVSELVDYCTIRFNELYEMRTKVSQLCTEYSKHNNEPNLFMPMFPYGWSMGQLSSSELPSLMLLGYKTTGRGSEATYDYTANAIKDVIEMKLNFNIGIDTATAQQLSRQLDELGVPRESYYTKEGVASCYIDAVTGKMSASSYNDAVATDSMDVYSEERFIDTFNGYQKTAMSAIPIQMI